VSAPLITAKAATKEPPEEGIRRRFAVAVTRDYLARPMFPKVAVPISWKTFPSSSGLWVVHTSFTTVPCAQLARNFAGFEQRWTSQVPWLTGSK
jgi:hypothetical protein